MRPLPSAGELVEHLQRVGYVVAVVVVRLLDRLRHDDPARPVDGRVQVGVLVDESPPSAQVGDLALVEDPVADAQARPDERRVEHDRGCDRPPFERRTGDRTDVCGAAVPAGLSQALLLSLVVEQLRHVVEQRRSS